MKLLSKNRFLTGVLIFAFVLVVAPAQSFASSWAQSYGVGSYDTHGATTDDPYYGSGFDSPVAIAKMPDGGMVVAAQIDLPRLYKDLYSDHTSAASDGALVRFASDGTILWQITLHETLGVYNGQYFSPAPSHIAQMQTDAQGNVFILGGRGNPNNSAQLPFVAKFSPDGELLWHRCVTNVTEVSNEQPPQIYNSGITGPDKMGLTNDGGVVIMVGTSYLYGGGYSAGFKPVIAKFDNDGTLSFFKTYNIAEYYATTGPICQTADGSKYVAVLAHGVQDNSSFGLIFLVVDASTGNVIAQRAYASPANGREFPISMVRTSDGSLAVLSTTLDGYNTYLRKLNADASAEVFEEYITSPNGVAAFWPSNLSETADGGFLIGGHTSVPNSGYVEDAALMKVSSNGSVQFVSVIGGPNSEGGPYSNGPTGSFATPTTDGGYGLATVTLSYVNEPSASQRKPDLWLVKTDGNRHVRNFTGNMAEIPPGNFNVTGTAQAPSDYAYLTGNLSDNYTPQSTTDTYFVLQDLGSFTTPDLPTFTIQASSPRIISNHKAEAIVEQHFSYQIQTAFFPDVSQVTYSAEGLPQHYQIDSQTGKISGISHPGDETVENNLPPIPIQIHATDGTDTANGTLYLAISDGTPLLTVNGSAEPAYPNPSATPVPDQADKVLSFAAVHYGTQAKRVMNVEATTTPDNANSWQWLQNGSNAYMTYDTASKQYVLNSTSYPQQDGVYFRSKLKLPGRPDSISNVVGPFNLASGTTRAGQPAFSMIRNGLRADFDFRVVELGAPSGVALRVQRTTTPSAEGSWTDLPSGQMTEDSQSHIYSLTSNDVTPADGVYFRAVASVSGTIDSLSNIIGPYNLVTDIPPNVTLYHPDGSSSGTGQQEDPLIFRTDGGRVNLHITGEAHVTPPNPRFVKNLKIMFDSSEIESRDQVETIAVDYTTNLLGLHQLDLIATDDLGAAARAGTGKLWIRIDPAGSHVAGAAGKLSRRAPNVANGGDVFYLIVDGGDWANPNSWVNSSGSQGRVPGVNDEVIITNYTVVSNIDVQVAAMVLTFGHIKGTYLTIGNSLTVVGGDMGPTTPGNSFFLTINSGATCLMLNPVNFVIDGDVYNNGKWQVVGIGGLSVHDFHNTGISDFRMPLPDPQTVAGGISLDARAVSAQTYSNAGQISVAGLITNDGGGLITNDGGGLVNPAGGTVVAAPSLATDATNNVQQGSLVISNDGASLITNDGGSLAGQVGGNIAVRGNGSQPSRGNGLIHPNKLSGTSSPGFQQTGGTTDLNFMRIIGSVDIQGGIISGSGIIDGDLSMNGGQISPGHSAGYIAITGNYTQSPSSTMILEAAGGEAGQFDQVHVGQHATFAGTLEFHTLNNYVPLPDDPFNPLGYDSFSGNFDQTSSHGQVTLNPTGMLLALEPIPAPPVPVATDASSISGYSFLTNWNAANGATGYRLDVATDSSFTNYVPRYRDRNVGNVTSFIVKGLLPNTNYFYRVRSYNDATASTNSNTITVLTFPANPPPTPTPKPRPTPSATPTPTPRPSATPKS